jgi:hypothetical protein
MSLKMKVVWIYLCDNCDHAGVWDINLKLLSFQVGEPVTISEIEKGLGDKVKVLSNDKLFIPSFVEFQYGELNPENRVHNSVLIRLKNLGAYKGLTRTLLGTKDKDKDKDKEKDKEKGECEGVSKSEIDDTYSADYPLKKGKARGIKLAYAQIKTRQDISDLKRAIANYKATLKREGTEARYIKHFSTFMGEWRDWLDPAHGSAESFSQSSTLDPSRFVKPGGAA